MNINEFQLDDGYQDIYSITEGIDYDTINNSLDGIR